MTMPSATTPADREHRLLVEVVAAVRDRREQAPFLSELGEAAGLSPRETDVAGAALVDDGLIRGVSSAQSDTLLKVLGVSAAAVRRARS